MDKFEINSKLNQLAENEEKINKEAEAFIQLQKLALMGLFQTILTQ